MGFGSIEIRDVIADSIFFFFSLPLKAFGCHFSPPSPPRFEMNLPWKLLDWNYTRRALTKGILDVIPAMLVISGNDRDDSVMSTHIRLTNFA